MVFVGVIVIMDMDFGRVFVVGGVNFEVFANRATNGLACPPSHVKNQYAED